MASKQPKPENARERLEQAAERAGLNMPYSQVKLKLLRPDQIIAFAEQIDPDDPLSAVKAVASYALSDLHRRGAYADVVFSQGMMGQFETLGSIAQGRKNKKDGD